MSSMQELINYLVFGVNVEKDRVAEDNLRRLTEVSFSDGDDMAEQSSDVVSVKTVYSHNESLLSLTCIENKMRSFNFYLALKVASSFYNKNLCDYKASDKMGNFKDAPFSHCGYPFLGAIDSASITPWAPAYFIHNLFKLPLVPCYAIQTLFQFGFAIAYNKAVDAKQEGCGSMLPYGFMALVLEILQLASRITTSLVQCLLEPVNFIKRVHKHSGNNYVISGLATLAVAAVYVAAPIVALKCLPVVAAAWATAKVAVVTKALPFVVSPTLVLPSFSLMCVALRGFYSYFKHRTSTSNQNTDEKTRSRSNSGSDTDSTVENSENSFVHNTP